MANTIVDDGLFVSLTDIDSDYDIGETLRIDSISFQSGADTDRCVIKNGSATGPVVFDYDVGTHPEHKTVYFHGTKFRPFLDVSDGSFNAAAMVTILRKRSRRG